MTIPNVAPGPLRSVKQPGMLKTAQFHQKRGLIRKIQSLLKSVFLIKAQNKYQKSRPRASPCTHGRDAGGARTGGLFFFVFNEKHTVKKNHIYFHKNTLCFKHTGYWILDTGLLVIG